MKTFDLTPLYKSAIGFDRFANLLDEAKRTEVQNTYPPYNIELTGENAYRITMAVAGFTDAELDIEIEADTLTIKGQRGKIDTSQQFLHQGIAARNFERRFKLADHVRVQNANLEHGLLHVDLVREVPEVLKPRKIQINNPDTATINAA